MKENSAQFTSKLWSINYVFLLLANIAIYLAFYMIVPTIAGHTKDIGGSSLEASLAISIFSITSLAFRLISGNAADKMGKKPIAVIGIAVCIVSTISYYFVPVTGLLLMRILQGVGWGMSSAAVGAAFSDIVAPDRRGEGLGYYSLTMAVSMSLAPLVAIMIMNGPGFNIVLATSITFLIIGIPLLEMAGISERGVKQDTSDKTPLVDWKNLFEKRALLPGLLCFICVITLCAIMSYIYLFGKEIKMTNIWIYFLGHVTMVLITRPFVGKIFDKKGHKVVIIPGAICMGLGVFLLSLTNSIGTLIIASLFFGFGYGATQPSLLAWAVNRSPANRKGAATGTILCSMDLSFTLGPFILSFIADKTSYAVMYRLSSVLMVLFLVIYLINIVGRKKSVIGEKVNVNLEQKINLEQNV